MITKVNQNTGGKVSSPSSPSSPAWKINGLTCDNQMGDGGGDRHIDRHGPLTVTPKTLKNNACDDRDGRDDQSTLVSGAHPTPGNGQQPEPCAQCNADDGKLQFYANAPNALLGAWLHNECKPFYFGER
jgi:hypothetical protein